MYASCRSTSPAGERNKLIKPFLAQSAARAALAIDRRPVLRRFVSPSSCLLHSPGWRSTVVLLPVSVYLVALSTTASVQVKKLC